MAHRAIACLLLAAAALAGPIQEVADAVEAAHRAGEDLAGLSRRSDPWQVADELCLRGAFDTALAFARAAPRKDTEKLPAYVAALRERPPDPAQHQVLTKTMGLLGQRKFDEAMNALEAVTERHTLTSLRVPYLRGMCLRALGRSEEAIAAFLGAADAAERVGWYIGAASALQHALYTAWIRADYARALELGLRRLAIQEARGDPRGIGAALGELGNVFHELGEYERALEHQQRALALKQEAGDRSGVALTLGNIAALRRARGEFALSLRAHEEALRMYRELGDAKGLARSSVNLGNLYWSLGDDERALQCYEEALERNEALGDRRAVAVTLGNIGLIHRERRDVERALEYFERARRACEALGDGMGATTALVNLGTAYTELGRFEEARKSLAAAVRLKEELGDQRGAAVATNNLGELERRAGNLERALELRNRALAAAEAVGAATTVLDALHGRADAELAMEKPDRALETAQRAVERARKFGAGLSDRQAAMVREKVLKVYNVGTRAALATGDVGAAALFLEGARAAALLEALGGSASLATALPPELRRREREARKAVARARRAHRATVRSGTREEIRGTRERLAEAEQALAEVTERIQRQEKAAADVLYPAADDLAMLRQRLRKGEALVIYGLLDDVAVALVVDAGEGRLVRLGDSDALRKAARAAATLDPARDAAPAFAELRKRAWDPLGVTARRVLVSPADELCYVPFALLAKDREVVYVPSGTTYGVLREQAGARGREVLALGDPAYDTQRPAPSLLRAGELGPLPAAAAEAKAVGDRVLVGEQATEAAFREVVPRAARWRAVHLACHGVLRPERPMFSYLALAPAGAEDGFLTPLEIMRLRIPADLVVLSACDTARGKVYRAEGVVGFTRAFMVAGAPRVLVSLWKVDDAATHALMVRFYELWNPPSPRLRRAGPGLGAAAALKRAQEHVASHAKWSHPYYWAAWQLWGLGD